MAIEPVRLVRGRAVVLRGDNIDTDRIIPARFLRAITFEGLDAHLFEDDRQANAGHPFNSPSSAGATILLVNANFGCGSSREHAPQAIRRRGIRAIVGESFSEIFFGNAVALGMPCLTARHEDVEALMNLVDERPGVALTIDIEQRSVTVAGRTLAANLPAAARQSFLDGSWDATALLLDRCDEVERVTKRLPYINGW